MTSSTGMGNYRRKPDNSERPIKRKITLPLPLTRLCCPFLAVRDLPSVQIRSTEP